MRRKDREITDPEKIREIILACSCCRLGFCDDGDAYIVPLNFGYEEADGTRTFYFHGAKEGRKIDLIERTHRASFELDTGHDLITGEAACDYSMRYQSVMGTGVVTLLEDPEEKRAALQRIMAHHTGKSAWTFPSPMLKAVCIFKLEVETLSCKEHP